jgi:sRNA-binding carbon storage regulator CsrA
MLVLARKPGEEIHLFAGDQKIVVKVVSISDGRAWIGITADKSVAIRRPDAKKQGPKE